MLSRAGPGLFARKDTHAEKTFHPRSNSVKLRGHLSKKGPHFYSGEERRGGTTKPLEGEGGYKSRADDARFAPMRERRRAITVQMHLVSCGDDVLQQSLHLFQSPVLRVGTFTRTVRQGKKSGNILRSWVSRGERLMHEEKEEVVLWVGTARGRGTIALDI